MAHVPSITTDMLDDTYKPSRDVKLSLFRSFGFRYVHWCDDWNNEHVYSRRETDTLAGVLADRGLTCIDVHGTATRRTRIDTPDAIDHRRYIHLLRNRIEFCAAVGGDAVVIHPPDANKRTGFVGRDRLRRVARAVDAVRPACERLGVRLAIENMGFRQRFNSNILEWFFQRYPAEIVGWCFDSGHANLARDARRLYAYGDRLAALHLHDNRGKKDDHQPPFFGTVDWPATMEWLRRIGYPKPINFEISHRAPLFSGPMREFVRYATEGVRRAMTL